MSNKPAQPLARRIVIAFTLMTMVVSGALSAGIVIIVHWVEESLVSQALDKDLHIIIHDDLPSGKPLRLGTDTWFYTTALHEYAIPERLMNTSEGFSEIVDENNAYYAYTLNSDGQRYILVQDQQEFEARERAIFSILFISFFLTVAAAALLGRLTAKRVMAPVVRLAAQIRHRDQLLPLAPPLAPNYANDEVGHLARAFDSTLGQLREALERERLFTSDVSHELRTPLMVIATTCELLEHVALSTKEQEQLQRIERATEEMRSLVNTFLLLARGSNDINTDNHLPLCTIAHIEAARWQPLIQTKGLMFSLEIEGDDDGTYNTPFLRTVISNLLRNALHYTEKGTIRLILEQHGFRVEDTGIGITADEKEKVFNPFVRGEQGRGEGLGLGLSLVKRICHHQGWRITLTDLPTGGSRFHVSLT